MRSPAGLAFVASTAGLGGLAARPRCVASRPCRHRRARLGRGRHHGCVPPLARDVRTYRVPRPRGQRARRAHLRRRAAPGHDTTGARGARADTPPRDVLRAGREGTPPSRRRTGDPCWRPHPRRARRFPRSVALLPHAVVRTRPDRPGRGRTSWPRAVDRPCVIGWIGTCTSVICVTVPCDETSTCTVCPSSASTAVPAGAVNEPLCPTMRKRWADASVTTNSPVSVRLAAALASRTERTKLATQSPAASATMWVCSCGALAVS